MKYLLLNLFMFASGVCFSQIPPEIQDANVIGINKLPARTIFWPSPNEDEARKSDYDHSIWVKSLNGRWFFHWSPDPMSRPVEFYRPEFVRQNWATIDVPSTIERQGFGTALYTNSIYPFKVNPPFVMDEPDPKFTTFGQRNPVGSYCRNFTIPETWKGKRILLHLAGSSSATFIWVNGKKVGYSQDSRLPAEFDLTEYLVSGENFLAIETYKYCDGSYLEDQDYWRFSGMYRDVFIRAVPQVTLWDLYAQPLLNLEKRQGSIALHYTSGNFSGKAESGFSVEVSVTAPSGLKVVREKTFPVDVFAPGFGAEIALPEIDLGKVQLWYDENPLQYTVWVKLKQQKREVEVYKLPVAFRKIEVAGNALLLNGNKFKVRGVNRHEFSPDQGWTISRDEMILDLTLMKQANINFVRNAHYPNDPRWYELCDKFGIMVMDEANVESHGLSYHKRVLPGDQPEWTVACVDRMKRMVIRDRQFPCVLMWSLGNEAGYGNAFLEMRKVTHASDPEMRLIQYADMNVAADMDSQTYPTIEWLKQHLMGKAARKGERGESTNEEQHGKYPSGRPFLLNEYAHSMGNSLGNFKDYWELFYQYDMLVGGFTWDWVDQSLWKNQKKPADGFVYGGDFGEFPTDKNFSINGLIGSDRIPHPHYYEMQKVHQPVSFSLIRKNPIVIELNNRQMVTNLNEYDLSYSLIADGHPVSSGLLYPADIAPLSRRQISLPENLIFDSSKECFLTIALSLKEEHIWAPKGHRLAWEQFQLSEPQMGDIEPSHPSVSKPEKVETSEFVLIKGNNFMLKIDKSTGMISEYQFDGKPVIQNGVRFNFWRAMTDNDIGWKVNQRMKVWENEANQYKLKDLSVESNMDKEIVVKSNYLFVNANSKAEIRHTISPDGKIRIGFEIDIPENATNLPRIGLQFEINRNLNQIDWYGRGPHENYIDRKSGAALGIYHSNIEDFATPYIRPQENANRCEVRWIRFGDDGKQQVQFSAGNGGSFAASAWPYSQQTLNTAKHGFELAPGLNTIVNIDCTQMGVGGDNSWGLPVLKQYQIKPGKYQYSIIIQAQ